MSVIAIPSVLREKLGEGGAEALAEILDKVEESSHAHTLGIIEERFEKRLAETKADLIKWMFIFIFGQYWLIVGTITGILFAFFRK